MSDCNGEQSGGALQGGGEDVGVIEDAVSFLDRAQKVCSDVSLLLNAGQLLALDFDPTQPFSKSSVSID